MNIKKKLKKEIIITNKTIKTSVSAGQQLIMGGYTIITIYNDRGNALQYKFSDRLTRASQYEINVPAF